MGLDLAVDLFMAIRKITMLNRIQRERGAGISADGRQLQLLVCPSWHGFAFYWLGQDHIKKALDLLVNSGLVIKDRKNSGPQGYGCDQLYTLTNVAYDAIRLSKDPRTLEQHVYQYLQDSAHSKRSTSTY